MKTLRVEMKEVNDQTCETKVKGTFSEKPYLAVMNGAISIVINTKTENRSVIAQKGISKGTCVLAETPLIAYTGKDHRVDEGRESYSRWTIRNDFDLLYEENLKTLYPRVDTKQTLGNMKKLVKEDFYPQEIAARTIRFHEKLALNAFQYKDDVYEENNTWCVLYNYASFFNHSCEPNANWYVDDKMIIHITTTRDIASGEEICIAYNKALIKLPKKNRRRELLKHYEFECQCKACIQ